MRKRFYVSIGERQYTVTYPENGYPPNIWTSWEIINPRTVWSVHPEYFTRNMSVSPDGKLGRKILKLAKKEQK
jgi:hypothetical protein